MLHNVGLQLVAVVGIEQIDYIELIQRVMLMKIVYTYKRFIIL